MYFFMGIADTSHLVGKSKNRNRQFPPRRASARKIKVFTPTVAPRLRRATWINCINQREMPADQKLQNLKLFTRVNTTLAALSLHSSHLGVTYHPHSDAVGSAFFGMMIRTRNCGFTSLLPTHRPAERCRTFS